MGRAKLSNFEKANYFEQWNQSNNIGFRWISGKFFLGDDEIDPKKWFLNQSTANPHQFLVWSDVPDLMNFLDCYILAHGTTGAWPLTKAARRAADPHYILKGDFELAFPLTPKQLIIINILLYHPEEECLFILSGVGGSGKSTFANIIRQLLANDVFAANLSDLSNEFIVAEAVKKRLIYSDELASDNLKSNVIKQLASRDDITANPKGRQPYTTRTQSSLVFACNKPPKIDITDTGLMRRVIYYYRPDKIENPDPSLRKKEYTLDELSDIAWAARQHDIADWRDSFKDETRKLLVENNSVYLAMKKWTAIAVPKVKGTPLRSAFTYQMYDATAKSMGLKSFSQPNFDEIVSLFVEWGYMLDG